ncbi:putative glutamate decarboxylase [Usnea florida]
MVDPDSNLTEKQAIPSRADEVSNLLNAVQDLLIPFIRSADEDASTKKTGHGLSIEGGGPRTALVEHHKPQKLSQLMHLDLPQTGLAQEGFLKQVEQIMQYSVNTWDRGFMSKLYASTDAPGIAAELILATLNTNVHTYEVSPALTLIEKHTTRALANLFGLNGPHAGGISVQGGSSSNTTSIVIARNTLYPVTKTHGNTANNLRLVLFTSAHGHYSIEKAAQTLGLGSSAVISVPVDPQTGSMDPAALTALINKAKQQGQTPFYLNATAGTTVLGSYDPIPRLATICSTHNLWLHIDASWGGPAIFSPTHAPKLTGSHRADSIAVNPHKMMGVPITCSFLLGADMRQFHASNTLPANYLFHSSPTPDPPSSSSPSSSSEIYDLADLTLQCGRRGDSLKLYLGWIYHGTSGYAAQIDSAFATAAHLASLVASHPDLILVSENPPPCCQVCFYYVPATTTGAGEAEGQGKGEGREAEGNGQVTKEIVRGLVPRGFMIDYAGGDDGKGAFMRVVVSRGTGTGTVEGLVEAVVEVGRKAWGRVAAE